MTLFSALFSLGRLRKPPKSHVAGRHLAPASVQRTALGIRQVDLPAGIVTLRSGELRAILAVSGLPLHHASQEAGYAWLQRWARAIQAMPPEVTLFARSRAGLEERYLRERRNQAAALATRAPGSALACLAADQLGHVRRLAKSGEVRRTVTLIGVRNAGGNLRALVATIEAVRGHVTAAGLRAELVRDRALAELIAHDWRTDIPEGLAFEVERDDGRPSSHHLAVQEVPTVNGYSIRVATVRPGPAPNVNGQAHVQVVP